MVRTRDDLVDMRVAATNQLAALLDAHWPGAKAIFADVESPISLAFLTRYPTAAAAAHLGGNAWPPSAPSTATPAAAPAAQLLARLRAAPAGTTDQTLYRGRPRRGPGPGHRPDALNAALKDLGRSVTAHLGEHPDGEIFTSLPRSGQINAAQMLAEWGDAGKPTTAPTPSPRSPASPRSPRSPANTARCTSAGPATNASASRSPPSPTTAATTAPGPPASTPSARARGKDHPHAVRILARAWIRVIWRCWNDHTPYDPNRHGGAKTRQPVSLPEVDQEVS